MMDRRFFLRGAAAVFGGLSTPSFAQNGHSLGFLTDVETARGYEPDGRFSLVLCMTAQQMYASCGEAFGGVKMAMDRLGRDKVEPIFILPNAQDQPDPSRRDNYTSASRVYGDEIGFTFLTGRIPEMRRLNGVLGGRVFEINEQIQKVTNHTLDAFLLSPTGDVLDRRRAEEYGIYADELQDKMDAYCPGQKFAGICFS